MASGLDNLFTTYGNDYGALGAYQAGQRRGLADMGTRIANDQRSAELERFTAQTPDSNRLMAAQARAGELGNMQGEADAAAGVHGAVAGKTAQQARLEAERAKAAFDQLPLETQAKFHNGVREKNAAMLNNLEQVITQTGDLGQAVSLIETEYPDVVKDKGWAQAKQRYMSLTPDQVLQEIRTKKASLASSNAYGDPKFQGDMIKQDAALASAERQQKMQADASIGAARERAAATQTKPTTEQFIYSQLQALYPNAGPQELAKKYMEYKTIQEKIQQGIVPELDSRSTTVKGGGSGPARGTPGNPIKLD